MQAVTVEVLVRDLRGLAGDAALRRDIFIITSNIDTIAISQYIIAISCSIIIIILLLLILIVIIIVIIIVIVIVIVIITIIIAKLLLFLLLYSYNSMIRIVIVPTTIITITLSQFQLRTSQAPTATISSSPACQSTISFRVRWRSLGADAEQYEEGRMPKKNRKHTAVTSRAHPTCRTIFMSPALAVSASLVHTWQMLRGMQLCTGAMKECSCVTPRNNKSHRDGKGKPETPRAMLVPEPRP